MIRVTQRYFKDIFLLILGLVFCIVFVKFSIFMKFVQMFNASISSTTWGCFDSIEYRKTFQHYFECEFCFYRNTRHCTTDCWQEVKFMSGKFLSWIACLIAEKFVEGEILIGDWTLVLHNEYTWSTSQRGSLEEQKWQVKDLELWSFIAVLVGCILLSMV